jgi:type I restriction enzyme S subunit
VIPEDWDVTTVGNSFIIKNNLRLPISKKERESIEGQFPYYGSTGIQGYINEYRLDGEYALIGEDGDHFLKWSSMPMTQFITGKCNVNNHAHIIQGNKNLTVWFYWFFYHRDITSYLSRQGAGRYKLNKNTLINLPCVIPNSVKEQTAIATVLSDVDALITSLTNLIDKKRQIKTATMQQLLTGKQRLAGFGKGKGMKQTELGEIPEDWAVKKLGLLLKIKHGKSQHRIQKLDGIYPILATGGEIGRTNTPLYTKPSVLIGRKGTINNPQYRSEPFWTVDTLFYTEINANADIKFIYYKFCSINWLIYNEASGVPSLNAKTIESVDIIIPTTNQEQQAIAQVLSDMDDDINALETRLAKTKAIKQGMMQELLTGKTRLV